MDGSLDGWTDGWMDEWMVDGCLNWRMQGHSLEALLAQTLASVFLSKESG